jgi:hypothetical protein
VVDAYGEGIPDTKVILTNAKIGIARTFMTSDDGVFDISGLVPADGYSLKLVRTGFANWETGTFEVTLGQALNFRIPLSPQAPAAHVEASSVLPVLDTTKMGVNELVGPRLLTEIPSGDLRWDALTVFAPPVGPFNPVFQSPAALPYQILDGVTVTNTFNPATAGPDRIAQDAIQAMEVLSDGYPAVFPGAFSGITDVATRSGGTGYHGDAYDFWRDGSLAASDRYAAGFKPAEHQHQGGLSIGGPIFRNKLFFFANYELLDGHYEGFNRITNPLIADPTGTFVLQTNCTATPTQCSNAAKFIQARMNVIVPRTAHSGVALAKIDYRKSDRNTFSFEGNGSRWLSPNGAQSEAVSTDGSLLGANGNVREDSRYLRASWVGTPHATTVNELRASWSRDDLTGTPDTGLYPKTTGPLSIEIAGSQIGASQGYPFTYPDERRREFSDTFSKAFNTQVIQFGGDYSGVEDSMNQIYSSGTYDYNSLTAFAQDFSGITVGRKTYSSYTQQFGNPIRTQHMSEVAGFAQDTWRVFPRFTVTMGARYELPMMPNPIATNPVDYRTGLISSPYVDGGPRAGLVYSRSAHTVFRGGYGWYFAPYSGQAIDAMMVGSDENLGSILVTPTQTGAPIFPTIYPSSQSTPAGVVGVLYGYQKLRNPRATQATASMEKLLSRNTTFTVSLLATRGQRLWTLNDANLPITTNPLTGLSSLKVVNYTIDNIYGVPSGVYSTPVYAQKGNLDFSRLYEIDSNSRYWRNAMTLQLEKRMGSALNFQAVYTWSHATDDAGYSPNGVAGVTGYSPNGVAGLTSVPGVPAADKGSSATDQRHRAVLSWTWQPTVSASAFPVKRYLFGGWALSGIATAASGLPETEQVMVMGQQASGSPMAYTSSLNGTGGWNRVPFDQIATLRPAPMFVVNARLSRTLRLGERTQAQLMFEAYNVANTQFNTSLNSIAYTASGGILKVAPGLGVGNASYGLANGTNARTGQVALRITF